MRLTLVIFGASGDLTSRKLVPALFQLFRKQRLPDDTRIVGFSRTKFSDDEWRASLAESTAQFNGERFDQEAWDRFAKKIFYQRGDIGSADDFERPARPAQRVGRQRRRHARLLPGHGPAVLRAHRRTSRRLRSGR